MKGLSVIILIFTLIVPCWGWAKEPLFLVKEANRCPKVKTGGGFKVTELIHRKNDGVDPGFSVAYIELEPGKKTEPHRLLTSSQVYYVIKGTAILHVGNKSFEVHPGSVVYIAPTVVQWAENKSNNPFVFLCVVSPPWRPEDEEIVKVKP